MAVSIQKYSLGFGIYWPPQGNNFRLPHTLTRFVIYVSAAAEGNTYTHTHTRPCRKCTHTLSLSLSLRFSCPNGTFLFWSLFLHNTPFRRFSIVAVCCGFAISALSFRCPFLPFYPPFMCLCSSFLRLFVFLFLPKTIFASMQALALMCHQSLGNCQYGRRATKQRSRSDCHRYFSFPSRLPHTSSSLILLRALVPKVKRTQLEAQHSILVQPMEIHINYTASMNKRRDECTI
jgi:hypothetical protein